MCVCAGSGTQVAAVGSVHTHMRTGAPTLPRPPSPLHSPLKNPLPVFLPSSLQLDYSALGVQQVWDCTGVFLTRKALQPYFDAGVPKVVVSAPVKDAEHPVLNIVYGVNHVRTVAWTAARR